SGAAVSAGTFFGTGGSVDFGGTFTGTGSGSSQLTLTANMFGGGVAFNGRVAAGSVPVNVSLSGTTGSAIAINASVATNGGTFSGTSNAFLLLGPGQSATSIGIGTGAGTFALTQSALNVFTGFSSQQIGNFGSGVVSVAGIVNLGRATTIQENGANGAINFVSTANVSVPTGQSFTVSAGGPIYLASGSAISAGSLSVNAG